MKKIVFALALLAGSPSASEAAGLQLSIQDGKVFIDAQEVTVRQILSEWARVGKTRIINGERVSGGPITIKFEGVPEKQALEIILRHVPGYMASPRQTLVANASVYDTIMIMPTTTAVAAVRPPPSPYGGMQPRIPGTVTQLQPPQQVAPPPEPVDATPGQDQTDDPAIAAAAAAGLVTIPAPVPGAPAAGGPIAPPTATSPAPSGNRPPPSNPWNAPVGTAQPSLAPPPAQVPPQPLPGTRPRPPQADR